MGPFVTSLLLFLTASFFCANPVSRLLLPELSHPHCLRVVQGELLILQDGTVRVYDATSGRFIHEFGRIGDGPGESRIIGKRGSMLWSDGQRVMIDSLQKISFFTRKGQFLQEIKKPSGLFFNLPLGPGFVSLRRSQLKSGEMIFELCQTSDSFTNPQRLAVQEPGATRKRLDLFSDALNFAVDHHRLIYEQGRELVWISTRDGSARKIKLPQSSFPVTESMKQAALQELAADWEVKQMGGLDELHRQSELRIPQTVPAVREFSIDGDLAFIWTFAEAQEPKMARFWLMELSTGRFLGEVDLPMGEGVALDDAVTGRIDRFYCFSGDWYYTLNLDDEQDLWQILKVNWRQKM